MKKLILNSLIIVASLLYIDCLLTMDQQEIAKKQAIRKHFIWDVTSELRGEKAHPFDNKSIGIPMRQAFQTTCKDFLPELMESSNKGIFPEHYKECLALTNNIASWRKKQSKIMNLELASATSIKGQEKFYQKNRLAQKEAIIQAQVDTINKNKEKWDQKRQERAEDYNKKSWVVRKKNQKLYGTPFNF